MASSKRCEGKRRMWRGRHLGTYKCGRVARYVFQTYTGYSVTRYACGEQECMTSITSGYPAHNVQKLGK